MILQITDFLGDLVFIKGFGMLKLRKGHSKPT